MIIFKNKVFSLILGIFIITVIGLLSYRYLLPKKLNILIISTCSLRSDTIGFYGNNKLTPNIDKIAANSFVFDNAFTDMSWSNVSGFLSRLTISELKELGYNAIGEPWTSADIPWQKYTAETPHYYYRTPKTFTYNKENKSVYAEDLAKIKKSILNRARWPFLLEIHSKIMHFPYGGAFPDNSPIQDHLSKETQNYISEYQKNIKKFPERIPFGLYFHQGKKTIDTVIQALNLEKQLADKIKELKTSPTFVGVLNNTSVLQRWKKSEYFERDLKVIKETYQKRLQLYDERLNEILNLYADPELSKNTVIIFTGDHGEAFFEHGHLVHGESVYDEMIRFPLFIKFPGQINTTRINSQFYQKTIYDIVRKIMSGELSQNNFEKFIRHEGESEFIFSRNCAYDKTSLRYKNEWKLIQDYKTDKKHLYNLKNDPKELIDVYEQHPDIANFLVEKSIDVANTQLKNKMLYTCTEFNN